MNILRHTENVGMWMNGYITNPISAIIYINGYARRHYIEIDIDRYKIIINELFDNMKCKSVIIDGYEPMLHKDIIDILSIPLDKGMQVALVTGNIEIDDTISRTLVKSCNMIIFRCEGVSPCKSITELSSKKLTSNMSLVIRWRYNPDAMLIDIINFFDQYIIPHRIDFIQIVPHITDDINKIPKFEDLDQFRSVMRAIFKGNENKFQFIGFDDIGKEGFGRCYERCHGGNFIICIGADGFVYPCQHYIGIRSYILGNYINHSIESIWEGKLHQQFTEGFNVRGCIPICCFHDMNNMLEIINKPLLNENIIAMEM